MHARRVAELYIFLKGFSSFFAATVYTIEVIYQAQKVGLNPFELILAGTVQQCVVFVCQAPTGALADMYSRRWAVVLGLLLMGCGFFIEGAFPTLIAVLIAQAVGGLGASLQDGADAAWIADEIGTERAGHLYLHATQIGWFCTLPGIALAAGLGSIGLNLPLLVGAGGYVVLSILLAFLMLERGSSKTSWEKHFSWQRMCLTLGEGFHLVRRSPVLVSILGISAFMAMSQEGFGRLWQYHLLHMFTFPTVGHLAPIVWFGMMEIGIAITNIVGIEVAHRWINLSQQRSVAWGLLITEVVMVLGMGCFALTGQFALAVAALWLITTASGPQNPLTQMWVNQQTSSSVRATVLSFNGQVVALAAMGGGLLIGVIANVLTTRSALLLTALLLLPACLLYAYTIRKRLPPVEVATMDVKDSSEL